MNTLQELLTIPRFSDLLLLTNKEDTDVLVKSVEISETPDIADFTSSQTLILTTAMVYKEDQSQLKKLIDSLVKIKAAGLAIKIGRFLEQIDPEVIEYAKEQHFSLIQVPATLPLGGVMQQLTSHITQSKTEQISYALDIQKQFSNLMLNDAGFSKIINEFSQSINCPVLLLDPFKELVTASNKVLQQGIDTQHLITSLKEENAFSEEFQPTSKILELHEQVDVAVYPIKSNNFFPYYLIIVGSKSLPYPASEFAIDQALLVLSFVFLRNDKVLDSKKQMKSDYFLNLIEHQEYHLAKEKNWSSYDTNFGIQLSDFYQIVYISMAGNHSDMMKIKLNEEKMKLAYDWLDLKVTDYFPDAVIFPEKNANQIILMIQSPISQQKLTHALMTLSAQLKDALPIDLLFSCGQSCNSIDLLSTSLVEAKIVWEECRKKKAQQPVVFYKPKGILNLFDSLQVEEVHYFCEKLLKELAFPTESMYIELRKTLKTFLDNQCEITKTANDLFIHRNTVKYRIDNCEELLGVNILQPENSLNLRIALELSEK